MPPTMQELGIDRLSVDDRITLAEAIWDSVAEEVEHSPLTDAQKQELERRIAELDANPDAGVPWEVVRDRALVRLRRRSSDERSILDALRLVPADRWDRVLQFLDALRETDPAIRTGDELTRSGLVGLWGDRDDLGDGRVFARRLRWGGRGR